MRIKTRREQNTLLKHQHNWKYSKSTELMKLSKFLHFMWNCCEHVFMQCHKLSAHKRYAKYVHNMSIPCTHTYMLGLYVFMSVVCWPLGSLDVIQMRRNNFSPTFIPYGKIYPYGAVCVFVFLFFFLPTIARAKNLRYNGTQCGGIALGFRVFVNSSRCQKYKHIWAHTHIQTNTNIYKKLIYLYIISDDMYACIAK